MSVLRQSTPEFQARLSALMDGTARNAANWHYYAQRPEPRDANVKEVTLAQALFGVIDADCSWGFKILCCLAGLPFDPTGFDWGPAGNSSSIYATLKKISFGQLQVGDAITFGPDHHVVMVREPGRDYATTKVWSNGAEIGPLIDTLAAEMAFQHGHPMAFCQLLPPAPANPFAGFAAWAKWWMGGRKGLRPNAPLPIPDDWWRKLREVELAAKAPELISEHGAGQTVGKIARPTVTKPAPELISEHGKGQATVKSAAKKTAAKKTTSTAKKSATKKKGT